jgi:hypothetical protein
MSRTDFLFARPSFMEGFARIVDFGGSLNEYNSSQSHEEADAMAIQKDFAVVGNDIWSAVTEYANAAK